MTSDQAKQILRRRRPGIDPVSDPEIAAALERAEKDPRLRAWVARQEQWHAAIREKVRAVEPPPFLRAALSPLARNAEERTGWAAMLRGRWTWRQSLAVGAAGAAAIALGAWLLSSAAPSSDDSFAHYRDLMAHKALREYRMDIVTNDLVQVRLYLQTHSGVGDFPISPKLQHLAAVGGAAFRWHGQPVSMLCLKDGGDRLLWCFVCQRQALRYPPPARPTLARVGKMATASWSDQTRVYLLATVGGESDLRKYF